MRETHFNKERNEYTCDYFHDENAGKKAIQKLGQHEDIEDKLGIDLATLFKALKDGIYVLLEEPYGITCYKNLVFKTDGTNSYLVAYETQVHTKNYGKSWALTKEELK